MSRRWSDGTQITPPRTVEQARKENAMNKRQAQALLALIADLYLLVSQPDPPPPPGPNGASPVPPAGASAVTTDKLADKLAEKDRAKA